MRNETIHSINEEWSDANRNENAEPQFSGLENE